MLNWFGSKASRHTQRPQSTVGPVQTLGNSVTSASDEVDTRNNAVYAPTATLTTSSSLDVDQHVSASERLDGTPFTPQDAIVAQVLGKSTDARVPPPSLMTSDSLPPPPSIPSSSVRLGPTLPIYDPFSGTKLGERTLKSPSTNTPGELSSLAPLPEIDDRKLWSSLERILELQAEIAAMHADMEGVGARGPGNTHTASVGMGEGGHVGRRKESRRSETLLVGDEEPEEHEPEGGANAGPAVSEISTDHSEGEDEGEDDGDEDNIYGYGKKRRDEEFSRLAEQFTQRKVAIGGIMNKLDDLSMALKTFHALPPPLLDLAMSPSRTDTMSSTISHVSAASSSFGLHQPSSSPLSISPSQAMGPITPPAASPSPPVPLVSTFTPPMSSESVRPGSGSIVAPVLPRTTVPTIIPGSLHVESPTDMDPTIMRRGVEHH